MQQLFVKRNVSLLKRLTDSTLLNGFFYRLRLLDFTKPEHLKKSY
jgi:hypothetical protein